jgi:hypothetical protein
MIICGACSGTISELGELPDYDNPCSCETTKLKNEIIVLREALTAANNLLQILYIPFPDDLKIYKIYQAAINKVERFK